MKHFLQNAFTINQSSILLFSIVCLVQNLSAQTCPNIAQGNYTAEYTQDTDPIIGQTFTAACTGVIQDIRFATANFTTAGTGTLNLYRVVNGVAGSPISSANYYINAHFTVFTVTLPTPIVVTNGETYMFLLVQGTENTQWLVSESNPYGGGDSVASSTNNTSNVATVPGNDLIFQVTYQAVLPVELSRFEGQTIDNKVILQWETASEFNNVGFTVQRAIPALEGTEMTWKDLDFVKGQGNSEEINTYIFEDKNPFIGKQFYRLKQEDYDETITYSEVVVVHFSKHNAPLTAYPNPSQGILRLPNLKEGKAIHIFNQQGQLLTSKVTDGNGQIELYELPSGIYYLQVQTGQQLKVVELVLMR